MSNIIVLHTHQYCAMSIMSKGETERSGKQRKAPCESDLSNDMGSLPTGQYAVPTMTDGKNAVVMKLL